MNTDTPIRADRTGGFTVVEVIVALLILTVGVLGLAGTTALVVRQVTMAQVATDRSTAVQSAIEQIRATDYDSLEAGSDSVGRYSVSWSVTSTGASKLVVIETAGLGLKPGAGTLPALSSGVVDTFIYRVIRP